ncbi:MAG: MBOAT family protein, partial [Clostridia bacterium]|nr:MBOAT family protein [Clostridia bacterium]
MVFSSLTFIYAFLPIVLVLYFICRNRIYRNVVLLIASLVFYAWCEPKLILLMLAATLCAYAGGLLIARLDRREKAAAKKWVMAICVILMLGVLFLFKYLGLFVSTIDAIVGGLPEFKQLALPIGISFYTFQIISYIIDVYRCKVEAERNFFWLLLYVCLFPQLIVGPIVRYETVADDIRHRQESFGEFFEGLERFIFGLAKKVLISNTVAKLVTGIYGYGVGEAGTVFTWIATLAYTFQLYFDFSGYSDMALGLGRMFGFHFRENFNYPYASVSVAEFWRRWHISLGSWFRDYVYIPLGGNRVSRPRHLFNIMVV